MRRFFSFRSSSSGGTKEDRLSPASGDENIFWDSNREDVPRNSTAMEKQAKPSSPRLRRSLSSSSTPYSREIEERGYSSRDFSESLSADSPIHFSLSPEKFWKPNRLEKEDHPGSSRNSPETSLVPLRCRSSRIMQEQNGNSCVEGDKNDKRIHPSFGRPPKSKYIPPQPAASSREETDTDNLSSSWVSGHVSSSKHGRKLSERDNFCFNESLTMMPNSCASNIHAPAASDLTLDRYLGNDFPGNHDGYIDSTLHMKLNQVKERITLMPELTGYDISRDDFAKVLSTFSDERNKLASELSLQLQCRISERSLAREALKQANRDLNTRTRRLEKEKDEIQSMLEREMERRSMDWSTKLEKFQSEEQRLRERVRELAEQNVSIQRELSSLSQKKSQALDQVKNLESKLIEVSVLLDDRNNENGALKQALSHVQEELTERSSVHENMERSYKEVETEAEELKKIVTKLHMTCSDQEKTIAGLRQSYDEQTGQQNQDCIEKLKMENVRLAGVEQRLRKDIESLENRVKHLKVETGSVLYHGIDKELHSQMSCLKREAFSLLNEGDVLCDQMIKQWDYKSITERGFDGYSIAELNMNLQSLRRAVEIFKGRVESTSWALEERSKLDCLEGQLLTSEREVPTELKLKAETLMTSMLREKLLYRELELELLQTEMGSLVREREATHVEIVSLKADASSLMHMMKDKEHRIARNDENLSRLQQDLHECRKELMVYKEMLPRISRDRDSLWEELKQSRETNMLLDYEVKATKKKIEALEEEVLMKEGQISILKDSLGKEML